MFAGVEKRPLSQLELNEIPADWIVAGDRQTGMVVQQNEYTFHVIGSDGRLVDQANTRRKALNRYRKMEEEWRKRNPDVADFSKEGIAVQAGRVFDAMAEGHYRRERMEQWFDARSNDELRQIIASDLWDTHKGQASRVLSERGPSVELVEPARLTLPADALLDCPAAMVPQATAQSPRKRASAATPAKTSPAKAPATAQKTVSPKAHAYKRRSDTPKATASRRKEMMEEGQLKPMGFATVPDRAFHGTGQGKIEDFRVRRGRGKPPQYIWLTGDRAVASQIAHLRADETREKAAYLPGQPGMGWG